MDQLETTVLAGGCFWCTEAVFIRLKGIISATSGYAGGKPPTGGENPTYEQVAGGQTGFAEAIQIKFDPKIISFEKILEVFWATHDPTTLNQQGADVGTEYRSAIFYHNEDQKQVALKSKQNQPKSSQIVTEIVPFTNFYTAEQYHQKFYEINKNSSNYCSIVIDPKIEKLLEKFNSDVKEEYLKSDHFI